MSIKSIATATALVVLLAAGAGARPTTHMVMATLDLTFEPANVDVFPGDTVMWTGLGGGFHPVVQTTAAGNCVTQMGGFNSEFESKFSFTVPIGTAPGTVITYKCDNHCIVGMRGTITVLAPPALPGPFNLTSPSNGATGVGLEPMLQWSASSDAVTYSLKLDNNADLMSPLIDQSGLAMTSLTVGSGVLSHGTTYHWGVVAVNPNGMTSSTPSVASFTTAAPPPCDGDADGSGVVNFNDVLSTLANFGSAGPDGDSDHNGVVNFNDILATLAAFGSTCP